MEISGQGKQTSCHWESSEIEFRELCMELSPLLRESRRQNHVDAVKFRDLCREMSLLRESLLQYRVDVEFRNLCKALSPLLQELSAPDDPVERVKDNSPSRLEWIRLKRTEGARSNYLDILMQMVGLEDAKALFLRMWAIVQIAKKQKKELSKSDLTIAIVGNRGIGRSIVETLYDNFLQGLGVPGFAYCYTRGETHDRKIRLDLPDYSDDELQRIMARIIAGTQWKVEGGPNGKYMWMMVRLVGSARGPGFHNVFALKEAWSRALDRQAERIHQEQREGRHPDCLLLTGEDLIGPSPAKAHRESPAWTKLQAMIGMEAVKSSVQLLFDRTTWNYHRLQHGYVPLQSSLNRVFLGPPGTGKTTVARLYGQLLADLGLLSSAEVVVKNPSDLIAPYLGQSEHRTKKILQETKGKVLIIDDAYMLYPGAKAGANSHSDEYRIAVIDTLVAELDNTPGNDRCVILLGYEEEMQEMFRKSNPGLARRFALADAFRFTNYTVEQLGQILDLKLNEQGLQATAEARKVAMQMLEKASERPNFGNGGDVENLLSHARDAYGKRIAITPLLESPVDVVLEPEDFDLHHRRHLQAAAACESRFQDLVGVEEIIVQMQEYQKAVASMRRRGVNPRPYIPFTFVFQGPPGTGKTSTARKVGQIFYDMGFLSSAEVIECSVSDLIASYQGQTGKQVMDLLEQALGKVLFIDEAYRLADGGYEKQAVDELVDGLTKTRYAQKLVVVLAGYNREMVELMKVNRGLRSRFPTDVVFHPLSAAGCWRVLQNELTSVNIRIVEERGGATKVTGVFSRLRKMESWANARDVKRLAGVLVRQIFSRAEDDKDPHVTTEEIYQQLELEESKLRVEETEADAAALPCEDTEWPKAMRNLVSRLYEDYKQTGEVSALEDIVHAQQIVAAT
ncbi:hypothetical protein ABOM_003124 [Aspergillus bombycis]|uniref:AAA+ ATPase domain-containing protein n=1 Tax=Aspergillus bombycis TaxID=109264 RepID=A0A1F8ABC0_9EURO|nr:hypothetical protein ABOM_003124 [Aspergillus bombycis]OGM49016.1 hypothetical protein ABOM_003124 [Aspergillus bombycis]